MIKEKMKALISLGGFTQRKIAAAKEISPQQFQAKLRNNAFRIDELIELADMMGFYLAFIDEKGDPVVKFDISDIKEKEL